MNTRFVLSDVGIDGETRPAVTGVLIRERGNPSIVGWLEHFRPDVLPAEYDLRAITSSAHVLSCRIRCLSSTQSPPRTDFELVSELEVASLR